MKFGHPFQMRGMLGVLRLCFETQQCENALVDFYRFQGAAALEFLTETNLHLSGSFGTTCCT